METGPLSSCRLVALSPEIQENKGAEKNSKQITVKILTESPMSNASINKICTGCGVMGGYISDSIRLSQKKTSFQMKQNHCHVQYQSAIISVDVDSPTQAGSKKMWLKH